jgi:hypothetical protein
VTGSTSRLAVAVGVCLVLFALPGCAADAAPGREPSGSDVSDAAARVDEWARTQFPQVYAGLETRAARVLVYRKPSPEFDAGLRALDLPAPAVPRDAPYAAPELEALATRIVGDIEYWRGQGIEIASVGARHDGSAVEVGSPQADQLAPRLTARYGPTPPAVVEQVGPIRPAN